MHTTWSEGSTSQLSRVMYLGEIIGLSSGECVLMAVYVSHSEDQRVANTIQYNTIQYNTIQYNTIQYNTIHLLGSDLLCRYGAQIA